MTIDYSKYEGCTEGLWHGGADVNSLKFDGTYIYDFNADTTHYIGRALPVRHASNKGREERLKNARLMADAPLLLAHCKKQDAEVERLREIKSFVEKIARQKKRNEQDVEDCLIDSDFAEAYDMIIEDARKALEVQS